MNMLKQRCVQSNGKADSEARRLHQKKSVGFKTGNIKLASSFSFSAYKAGEFIYRAGGFVD